MKKLLEEIRACKVCEAHLPAGCRPILDARPDAKIVLIGQAPGSKVHASGIPWQDASGKRLRAWLNIDDATFYDPSQVAIIPMGFCYPGKGRSGDNPPRPECAPLWHLPLLQKLKQVKLTLLIGQYAQNYYLPDSKAKNLTETVRNFSEYLPWFLPLPHPSPRNVFWLRKNPWFEKELLPVLQQRVELALQEN